MYKFKLLRANVLAFVFISFFVGSLFCEDDTLDFGGKAGWNNLRSSSNIKIQAGKYGQQALRLSSSPVNPS